MNQKLIAPGILVLVLLLLTACSASQTRTETEFGDSVRAMTRGQIHDPDAALAPQKDAVTGGDAYMLERVVQEYRTGGGKDAAGVGKAIKVGTGGSSSQ